MRFLLTFLLMVLSVTAHAESRITLSPARTIVLGGVIGGRTLAPMLEALDQLGKKKDEPIDIIISSPGGSVIVGSIIVDRMEQLKNEGVVFRCVVRDLAASMAFQLLLHCSERYSAPGAFLLWHPVRVFASGPVTEKDAESLRVQLRQADDVVLADLKKELPMKESLLMWHFHNETLHQAFNLVKSAPGFFDAVTNNIGNLYPKKTFLDTTMLGSAFGFQQIMYIHERFISQEKSL